MAQQTDHPAPGGTGPRGPAPAPPGSERAWQGPVYYNQTAAAAGETVRVESRDLLAAANALAAHVEQGAAAAGLRVPPRAAGHPAAEAALSTLAERFHAALAALDADRGAAVGNLQASARIYEAVEVRVRDELLNTLDHSLAGRTRLAPGGPAFPTQSPGR